MMALKQNTYSKQIWLHESRKGKTDTCSFPRTDDLILFKLIRRVSKAVDHDL